MEQRLPRHPVFDVLEARGENMPWLASQIGYSVHTVYAVRYGKRNPGPVFRARCVLLFGLPQLVLFHASDPTPQTRGEARNGQNGQSRSSNKAEPKRALEGNG